MTHTRTAPHCSGDDDEPPSPKPQARSERTAPSVAAADHRERHDPPVDLAPLATLLGRVLEHCGAPSSAEASLQLVDEDVIAELKADHLDGDGSPTDVLSFPIDGVDADAEMVGDVVLCPSVAAAQAPGHAGNLDDELALLVVHAGLHLAGHDHAEPEERSRMWALEKDLMTRYHRHPSQDPWREDQ